ncbi:hypothetical protein GQ55_6G133900 [Panicum hallii var. hallii]|uniref:Uncharacterized protein n=1 Tax=Panicum hallii var. hallii TaxID=1504633 RepID=A0A2T7D640_9POAL|nr:hypothetical protein GQ55_6G133900 [Panicum hallii var. hallii]
MHLCERKSESVGSSRTCSRSRRRHNRSGSGGATWRSEERASVGWRVAARVLGRHVAQREAARGQQMLGTWPARAAGVGQRGETEQGAGGRRRGLSCNFPKVQGLHCKA